MQKASYAEFASNIEIRVKTRNKWKCVDLRGHCKEKFIFIQAPGERIIRYSLFGRTQKVVTKTFNVRCTIEAGVS